MTRIVVAGAGICGMGAAIMLAKEGHEVTVVERDRADVRVVPPAALDRGGEPVALEGELEPLVAVVVEEATSRLGVEQLAHVRGERLVHRRAHQLDPAQAPGDPAEASRVTRHASSVGPPAPKSTRSARDSG